MRIRAIKQKELIWNEFMIIFSKKYLSERYYDNKAKELYELNMGVIIDEEYTTKFMGLLMYVPYVKDEKAKF